MAPIAAIKADQLSSVRDHLDETRSWFSRKETIALIEDAVPATRQWLEGNEEHYPASLTRTEGPWRMPVKPTEDGGKRRARVRGLGYQVYENGLLNFLDRLSSVGVVDKPIPIEIRALATDSDTIPVIEQLVMDDDSYLDLVGLAAQFGLSQRTAPAKARDRQLIRLVSVGLLLARTDGRGYAITLGPVAKIFYRDIFAVMLEKFEKEMDGNP